VDKQSDRVGQAAKGRRYPPGERVAILKDAGDLGVARAAPKHGCSKWTIYDWPAQQQRATRRAAEGGSGDAGGARPIRTRQADQVTRPRSERITGRPEVICRHSPWPESGAPPAATATRRATQSP
jgi:transposase-like protein